MIDNPLPPTTNGKVDSAADRAVKIRPLNMHTVELHIEGTAPLVIARFSEKAKALIRAKHEAGGAARSKKSREARDFQVDYEAAMHVSNEGWHGIHAAAFRNAAIDACGAAGFVMTKARMGVFIEADGFDEIDGVPLVRITNGEPECWIAPTRNQTGVVDLRARPMWREWGATVRVRYDADMFALDDIVNLFHRVGQQVGVGEGRPKSKNSNGIGMGTFRLV